MFLEVWCSLLQNSVHDPDPSRVGHTQSRKRETEREMLFINFFRKCELGAVHGHECKKIKVDDFSWR